MDYGIVRTRTLYRDSFRFVVRCPAYVWIRFLSADSDASGGWIELKLEKALIFYSVYLFKTYYVSTCILFLSHTICVILYGPYYMVHISFQSAEPLVEFLKDSSSSVFTWWFLFRQSGWHYEGSTNNLVINLKWKPRPVFNQSRMGNHKPDWNYGHNRTQILNSSVFRVKLA